MWEVFEDYRMDAQRTQSGERERERKTNRIKKTRHVRSQTQLRQCENTHSCSRYSWPTFGVSCNSQRIRNALTPVCPLALCTTSTIYVFVYILMTIFPEFSRARASKEENSQNQQSSPPFGVEYYLPNDCQRSSSVWV